MLLLGSIIIAIDDGQLCDHWFILTENHVKNKAKQPVTDITKQLPMTAQQAKLAALLAAQSNQPARIELNNMLPNRP